MDESPSVPLAKKIEYREGRVLALRALGEDEEELGELTLVYELEERHLGAGADEVRERALDIAARFEALGWPEEAAAWRER